MVEEDAAESGCDEDEGAAGVAGSVAAVCGRKKTQKTKRRMVEMMTADRMMR